ncbi:MAG: hypothetical protein ABJA37_07765 [Ferruginibacter sp.]
MKTVIFACIVIFFTSCGKDFGHLEGNLDWGGYTIIPDSNNKMKADILIGGTNNQFLAAGGYFTRYSWPTGDSSIVSLSGESGNMSIAIDMMDILKAGSYSFGHVIGQHKGIKIICKMDQTTGIEYRNNYDVLSGSLKIDSLTTTRVKGSFNVTCWNGTNSVEITNGSFVGNVR